MIVNDIENYMKNIEFYQTSRVMHPFTCGNCKTREVLKPISRNGEIFLECMECDYQQKDFPPVPSIEDLKKMNPFTYVDTAISSSEFQENITIRGVQIIVLNENNELLIAKRSPFRKDMTPRVGACRWNFIGGKLKESENYIEAAQRELIEEANIIVLKKNLYFIRKELNYWDKRFDPFMASLFICKINKEQEEKIRMNDEHTEYKFVSLKDIKYYNILGYTDYSINKEVLSFLSRGGR